MRRSLLFALIIAPALSAYAAFASTIARAGAFMRDCAALFSPEPTRLATDTFGLTIRIDGNALPRGIQNGLRHEAGVPRYSSDRKR
jgi:hypothetical protein